MNCKNRTLLVLQYLWEKTDEQNSASLSEIISYICLQGLPSPDPRSIKRDIEDLLDFGIDIVCERKQQNQYSIRVGSNQPHSAGRIRPNPAGKEKATTITLLNPVNWKVPTTQWKKCN